MIQFTEPKSIYMQIADHICANILSGELKAGERLLSVRDLAESIAVNPNTVQRSYGWLQEKGLLDIRRGIGLFVAEDAYVRLKQMQRDQFLKKELPALFSRMELLGIGMDDLQRYHQRHNHQI
jgi:GntR family transcriptional regulator